MKKRNMKEIGNNNIITKQGAISIARRRECLKYNQNAITLVALVITIIILLILVGVTINLTLGERGIFRIAEKAAKDYQDSQKQEMYGLNSLENEINNTIGNLGNNNTVPNIPVTNIEITPNSETIKPNETVQLTVAVIPSNATNKDVTWSSSNTDVATVAEDGKVTGVGEGTTTIIATAKDGSGKQGSCTVTVKSNSLYLYNEGNEHTAITGGWKTWIYGYGSPNFERGTNYLRYYGSKSAYAGGWATANKVDVTKYSKLKVSAICNNGMSAVHLSNSNTGIDAYYGTVKMTSNIDDDGNYYMDISDVNGEYYITIGKNFDDNAHDVTITKVWLEK